MTKFVKSFFGVCAIVVVCCAYAAYLLFSSPYGVNETSYVYVDADDTMDSVRAKVQTVGEAKNMMGFNLTSTLMRFMSPHTGRYAIEPNISSFSFVRRIANGIQTPIMLNVPQVRTIDDMIKRLAQQLMVSETDINALLNDEAFIDSLGYTNESLPCLFVPNSYEIYWNTTARKLLERLNKERQVLWNDERVSKAKAINMTQEEVTTLASIVESETSFGPEMATVAGLYINRLKVNMPLQSDPTVIFAIGDFTIRRVLNQHLQIDSPYNTYKNTGLPPGPIRISSIQGIDAVLNHEDVDYLYMCAKEDFSGSHNFTASYAEHLANARRYQQALNKRNIIK